MHLPKHCLSGALFALTLTIAARDVHAQADTPTSPSPSEAPPRPIDVPAEPQAQVAPENVASAEGVLAAGAPVEGVSTEGVVEPVRGEPNELELNLQTTQEDLQGLRTDLENFKFQWQRERDLHTAITTRYLKIGGVVQARFGWMDNPATTATSKDAKTHFDISSAILSFTGTLYRDYEEGRNLTYNLRFGVSKQTTGNSFLNLLDAQIIYNFLPTINPEAPTLTATVGQQQLPFGLEVSATEELRPVVRNAMFANAGPTNPNATLNLSRRDIGLIFRGELFPIVDFGYNYRVPVISYAFGVVNGTGPNALDDNNYKDIIARLAVTVPSEFNSWLRQFTVGGTAYLGKTNTFVGKDAARTLIGRGHSHRYGLDVYYNHWPFGLTYEYILADDYVATGTTKENPQRKNLRRDSHTGTFFLSFGEQFVSGFRNQGRFDDWWPKTYQPFLRYDRFDTNTESGDNHVQVYTGGFNLFLAETTKVQFNYNLTDTAANKDRYTHEVLTQAQFGF